MESKFPPPPRVPSLPAAASPTLTLRLPPLPEIDFRWLDLDEFLPPGATLIKPAKEISAPLYLTPVAKYPSTQECVSLDGNAVVGSRSEQGNEKMRHWLRLFRRGDDQARSIFQTQHSYEVTWAKDSRALAISHALGKNTGEVLVLRLGTDDEAQPVDVRDVLRPYFSEAQLASLCYNKVYRWSDGPKLIVRGVGRLASEPFDLFGYEVLVDAAHPVDPAHMHFMRGFVKAVTTK